jgi:hypothetical protein
VGVAPEAETEAVPGPPRHRFHRTAQDACEAVPAEDAAAPDEPAAVSPPRRRFARPPVEPPEAHDDHDDPTPAAATPAPAGPPRRMFSRPPAAGSSTSQEA